MATVKFNRETPAGNGSTRELVLRAHDVSSLGRSTFADLAGLFNAIKELSREGSTVHRLAGIGAYLADDWANLNDCEREALEAALEMHTPA